MNKRMIAAFSAGAAVAAVAATTGVSYAGTPAAAPGAAAVRTSSPAAYTESGAWTNFAPAGGTVAQLKLPAGKYVVNAQVVVNLLGAASGRTSVACLIAGLGDYRGLLNIPAGQWEMQTVPVVHQQR